MEEDFHEYEEMKEEMKKKNPRDSFSSGNQYFRSGRANQPMSGDLNFSNSNDDSFNISGEFAGSSNRQMFMGGPSFGHDSGRNPYPQTELARMHEILSKGSNDEDDEFAELERRTRTNFRDD
ncbi:unnamed protein product [Moneuplotes crassus]|uniref:Uncharacterized protein n=2 Tax=Euplotes crassus TaxID=5936 RepID=A0AAD1Y2Y5_EUPCR|nr:unnamed protein product [Moneuplotes crassus]